MTNSLRGEYKATIGGAVFAFDTTLGTIARIEEACGRRSILQVISGVVTERRAADQIALLTGALHAAGKGEAEAGAAAARATVPEAEAFVLALMGALGFKLAARAGEGGAGDKDPLDEPSAGDDGGSSPSAA